MPFIHHPLDLHLGPLEITGFGIAVMLAFIGGQIIAQHEAQRRGQDPGPVGDVVFASIIGTLIGAKVYSAILVGDWHSLFSPRGLVYWGGFIGACTAGILVCLAKRIPINRMADLCCLGMAAGYSIGRTGCWAIGDDYGRPWHSAWAVAFPQGSPPSTVGAMAAMFNTPVPPGATADTLVSVIPTQIIEVVLGFVVFVLVYRARKNRHVEGWLFGLYLVLQGAERFVVEFFRAKDDRFLGAFTLAQAFAVAISLTGVVWMMARSRARSASGGVTS